MLIVLRMPNARQFIEHVKAVRNDPGMVICWKYWSPAMVEHEYFKLMIYYLGVFT